MHLMFLCFIFAEGEGHNIIPGQMEQAQEQSAEELKQEMILHVEDKALPTPDSSEKSEFKVKGILSKYFNLAKNEITIHMRCAPKLAKFFGRGFATAQESINKEITAGEFDECRKVLNGIATKCMFPSAIAAMSLPTVNMVVSYLCITSMRVLSTIESILAADAQQKRDDKINDIQSMLRELYGQSLIKNLDKMAIGKEATLNKDGNQTKMGGKVDFGFKLGDVEYKTNAATNTQKIYYQYDKDKQAYATDQGTTLERRAGDINQLSPKEGDTIDQRNIKDAAQQSNAATKKVEAEAEANEKMVNNIRNFHQTITAQQKLEFIDARIKEAKAKAAEQKNKEAQEAKAKESASTSDSITKITAEQTIKSNKVGVQPAKDVTTSPATPPAAPATSTTTAVTPAASAAAKTSSIAIGSARMKGNAANITTKTESATKREPTIKRDQVEGQLNSKPKAAASPPPPPAMP